MNFPSLRSRKDFELFLKEKPSNIETFPHGRSLKIPQKKKLVSGKYFKIIWLENNKTLFGFKVSRYIGNAVRRNRVKRILRGFIWEQEFSSALYLIIAKTSIKFLSKRSISSELRNELKILFAKIGQ